MEQQTGTLNGCFSYYTKTPKLSGKTPLKLSKILAIVLRKTFLLQPAPPKQTGGTLKNTLEEQEYFYKNQDGIKRQGYKLF